MFSLKCLDGCGRISGRFPTKVDAELRWDRHVEVPSQALHRCLWTCPGLVDTAVKG